MAVLPTSMKDLSLTATSNYPAGTDAVGTSLDDVLRAHATIIRSTNALATTNIASAATTQVADADAESVTITGSVQITSLGTGTPGLVRELNFGTAVELVDSTDLYLGGANITTAARDTLGFRCTDTSAWKLIYHNRSANSGNASPNFTGTATYNSIEIGFRGVPLNTTNAAYTLVAGDAGKARSKTTTSTYVYTVPASVFSAGDVVTILNRGASGDITLAQGSGMTLQLAGGTTTGARTVGAGCMATIYFDTASHAFVGGAGVT